MPENIMIFVWLGLTVLFAVFELITAQLTTVWFALGSLTALIVSLFKADSFAVQIAVFTIVSTVSLILTRPLVKKVINKKALPTNADRAIGETAVVTVPIRNIEGRGEVVLKGTSWSARSSDGSELEEGQHVKVLRIEGVKLIVEKI